MQTVSDKNEAVLESTVQRCRERRIVIPTLAQQKDPTKIPDSIIRRLRDVGMSDVDPVNLFRITWKNEPKERGGLFNDGNWIEFPSSLTGVDARIVGIVGEYFPTGAHKVGAAFGCLVPRLITGAFDPVHQKAVWPSTGNYCRGGAFDCALLACTAVAILPQEMSRERFEWLRQIGAEVIATPGCESNVKEIYDKCWEIRRNQPNSIIFNQFEEFGNPMWHYHVTGSIIEEIYERIKEPRDRLSGFVSATGSAGTIAAGDYLRTRHPRVAVTASEALQCPTLLACGFGAHRIEGIGDKHVPWVHNVRNTDVICAVDDEQCMSLLRLFNEEAGKAFLASRGVEPELIENLARVGISGICNLISAIRMAKHFEFCPRDVIFLPLTDGVGLYDSRLQELRDERGAYSTERAGADFARYLEGVAVEHLRELTYPDRKALHNLKYFTWVEQQQRDVEELNRLWDPDFWVETFAQAESWDRMIDEFNQRTGLLGDV